MAELQAKSEFWNTNGEAQMDPHPTRKRGWELEEPTFGYGTPKSEFQRI